MELQKLSGERVDLDDYRGGGKWLLVMIWATDCHICHQQKPLISDFHDKHQNSDAEVLGIAARISMDNKDLRIHRAIRAWTRLGRKDQVSELRLLL